MLLKVRGKQKITSFKLSLVDRVDLFYIIYLHLLGVFRISFSNTLYINLSSAFNVFLTFWRLSEGRVLHEGAWVATLLGSQDYRMTHGT